MLNRDQILLWRGQNRLWADRLLHAEFGKLLQAAEEEIGQASWRELCFSRGKLLNNKITPHVVQWQKKQLARLNYKLEESFPKDIAGFGFAEETHAQSWLGSAASYFFSTTAATISWPFVASTSLVAGIGLFGRKKVRDKAKGKSRLQKRFMAAVETDLKSIIFGPLETKNTEKKIPFLQDVLEKIDTAAKTRLQEQATE